MDRPESPLIDLPTSKKFLVSVFFSWVSLIRVSFMGDRYAFESLI